VPQSLTPQLPTVSVVVATRNRPAALRQCLEAIAAQRLAPAEVIIADDGSSLETRRAYQVLSSSLKVPLKWVLFEHPDTPGTGPAAARNRGIRAATGTFVAFCDDDDRWISHDHLEVGVRSLEQAGADFFFCDVIATRDGVESEYVFFRDKGRLQQGGLVTGFRDVFSVDLNTVLDVVAGSVIHPDCWLVRRSLLNEAGEFWERLWFPEDYNLMMRILDRARKVLFRAAACVDYRLPVAGAHSLRTSNIEKIMQEIMAAQHVRMVCEQPLVRRHARARQAYGLRRLGREHRAGNQVAEARRLAWEGFWTYPTVGSLSEALFGSYRKVDNLIGPTPAGSQ
jgi:hypothetical protein